MAIKIYLSPSSQPGNPYAYGNTNEQIQCNRIAEAAKKALERCGYQVKKGPEGQSYQENTAQSNAWGADVHMPIHTNAGGGDGTVVYAYPASVNNKYVTNVYQSVANATPGRDDGIFARSDLYEINNSKAVCVYLECEFHDDPSLARWIIEHVEEIGEAIAKGFCNADRIAYVPPGNKTPGGNEGGSKKSYIVQAGSFQERKNAENLVKELKAAGFTSFVRES